MCGIAPRGLSPRVMDGPAGLHTLRGRAGTPERGRWNKEGRLSTVVPKKATEGRRDDLSTRSLGGQWGDGLGCGSPTPPHHPFAPGSGSAPAAWRWRLGGQGWWGRRRLAVRALRRGHADVASSVVCTGGGETEFAGRKLSLKETNF